MVFRVHSLGPKVKNFYDSVGNSITVNFILITDDTPPSIDHPGDISYIEGETGNTITWTAVGEQPVFYSLYRNNTLIDGVILGFINISIIEIYPILGAISAWVLLIDMIVVLYLLYTWFA